MCVAVKSLVTQTEIQLMLFFLSTRTFFKVVALCILSLFIHRKENYFFF
jgi:hypothetical protein